MVIFNIILLAFLAAAQEHRGSLKSCLKEACEAYSNDEKQSDLLMAMSDLNYDLDSCDSDYLFTNRSTLPSEYPCSQSDDGDRMWIGCFKPDEYRCYFSSLSVNLTCEDIKKEFLDFSSYVTRDCDQDDQDEPSQ